MIENEFDKIEIKKMIDVLEEWINNKYGKKQKDLYRYEQQGKWEVKKWLRVYIC